MIIGVDAGSPDVRAAEHLLTELVDALGAEVVRFGCTHLTRTGGPHVALSLELTDPGALRLLPAGLEVDGTKAAVEAAAAHTTRTSGRVVRFPGQDLLVGELTVQELLDASAVDRVRVLASPPPEPEMAVATADFVRPLWEDGLLTLHTVPYVGGRIAPFEVANPTPCCADHA